MAGTVCLVRESPIVARQPRNLGYTNPGRPSQCKWSKLLDALLEVTLRVEQKAFPNRQFSNAFYEVRQANAMTRIATPPPATEILDHAPPSLPSSPLAKRPKTTANTMAPSATTGEANAPAVPKLTSSQKPPLFIKKLSNNATTPTRGSAFAAGYDLYSSHETVVPARGKTLVDTDLAIAVPEGTYGRIAPRSGLASKNFIDTGAGVIDADYRGQVKVLLFNHAETDFKVKIGDRIAQLVLERIYTPDIVEVDSLEESVRGAGGFGSTG